MITQSAACLGAKQISGLMHLACPGVCTVQSASGPVTTGCTCACHAGSTHDVGDAEPWPQG